METIAVFNLKGGVGKTTLTVNLGAALSALGKRVLLIDIDPQQNLTQNLGANPMRVVGIEDFLRGESRFSSVVRGYRNQFDFIPAGRRLKDLDLALAGRYKENPAITKLFANAFSRQHLDYDYIIIDCPPSIGLLTANVLSYVKKVFIPVQCHQFALNGSKKTVSYIYRIKTIFNPALSISAVIPVMFDSRNKLSNAIIQRLDKAFHNKVTHTKIGVNIALAEAPGYGQTIFEYRPDSRGAQDVMQLAEEILQRELVAANTAAGYETKTALIQQ